MFARLRHDAFVRGDDEQGGVYAPDARQHVLDEVAVAGHVHDADLFAGGEREPAEAEVNRHLARLLFFEAVGMDARERGDERGLAVVYVACCADDAHGIQR